MTEVYLALGSNVGDSQAYIEQAVKLLGLSLQNIKRAPLYRSKAVGYTDQPDFLNTVISGQTDLEPPALFELIKAIEQQLGRIERFRHGPREIDIDLIFYGDQILNTPTLIIPHPFFHERNFVLQPLADLNPNFIDPISGQTIQTLLTKTEGPLMLPDFFYHCTRILARPATVQRDEFVAYSTNGSMPVKVVGIPNEASDHAYYFETEASQKLFAWCIAGCDSPAKLEQHRQAYRVVQHQITATIKLIRVNPSNYRAIFTKYRQCVKQLSLFLNTGLAVDIVLYNSFKVAVEKYHPVEAEKILKIVATPKQHHDYQKFRLGLCQIAERYHDDPVACETDIVQLAEDYRHLSEYSFVEPLLTIETVKQELEQLDSETARGEIQSIFTAIDDGADSMAYCKTILSPELLIQAELIKEYAWLRTDRIDQYKRLQINLRQVYENLALDFKQVSGCKWTLAHVVSLLDHQIDNFIIHRTIPDFKLVNQHLGKQYLYYYSAGYSTIITNAAAITAAKAIILKPSSSKVQSGSLINKGTTAYQGVTSGRVVKIGGKDDLTRLQNGDIMLARHTMPHYTLAMRRAAGIITAEGGVTSHAAIVARELGKPCIVGSENCLEVLKDGDLINLDATNQIVSYIKDKPES